MRKEVAQAFATIDALTYSKEWVTSGQCIEVVETWTDGAEVVRTKTHNFNDDLPVLTEEPTESNTAPDAEPLA